MTIFFKIDFNFRFLQNALNLNQYCAQKNSVHRVRKKIQITLIMLIRRQTVDPNEVSELCGGGLRNFSFLTSLEKYS